ncbi:MAG: hypothetical protein WCL50_01375 [Spirochaetota bacterium]
MRRNAFLSLCLLLLAALVPTGAAFADALDAVGLTVASRSVTNGQTLYVVKDSQLGEFSIISKEPLSETQVRNIIKMKELFLSWKLLKVATMTFMAYPSELEINVKPASFVYKEVELATYVTAGLGFFQTNVTVYNFRLFFNFVYPRITGTLVSEVELAEAILAAIRDPVNNPAKKPVAPPVVAAPPATKYEPPPVVSGVSKEDFEALKKELAALAGDNKSQLVMIEGLRKQIEGYGRDIAALRADLEKLRRAVLVLHNLGIFGDVRAIDLAGVEYILKMKAEKPSLLQEEVAGLLDQKGIKMTMNEIFLVFSVYFNEFK